MAASKQATRDRYGRQTEAVWQEMQVLMGGRPRNALSGKETLALMSLRARFVQLAMRQEAFGAADLAARLHRPKDNEPGNG
jgi:hypothetical protein